MAGGGGRRRRLVQYLMVLEVRRRPLNLGQPVRALHQLDHERDVGDGEAQGLDAGEPLLVGKGGNLRGRQTTWRVSHGRTEICNLDYRRVRRSLFHNCKSVCTSLKLNLKRMQTPP